MALTKAGFEFLPQDLVYQDGISSYRHTAQSRREGSIKGDFILSFRKCLELANIEHHVSNKMDLKKELIKIITKILQNEGPQTPDQLLMRGIEKLFLLWQLTLKPR